MSWTPLDEENLRWRFDGSADAALGLRSWLGPMIDRRASGATRGGSSPELRDYGAAAERVAAIDAVLARVAEGGRAGARHVRALRAQYGPEPTGLEGLDHLKLAPLMLVLGGLSGEKLKWLHCGAMARDAKATARLVDLRGRADRALADAQRAYAEAKDRGEDTPERKMRRAKRQAERERERKAAFAGRVGGSGEVVFEGARGRSTAQTSGRLDARSISVAT